MDVQTWVRERLPSAQRHLDVAACGRVSRAVLDAQVAHLAAEARDGGYVTEELAVPLVDAGRARLAELVGLPDGDVAFTDGAGAAFAALLAAWPLTSGGRVGTVGSEYRVHALVLRQLAADRGWTLVDLPVDGLGRVTDVPAGLDLLTLPQVASQRGIAQPVEDLVATGAPVVLDVAQSLGQVAVPGGCAAYVGTSRKWLCGPRGVGFVVAGEQVGQALATPPTVPAGATGLRRLEAAEGHVAGRVGLAVAAAEWDPALLPVVAARSRRARELLDGLGGWRVVEPVAEPSGLTTLRPPPGGDPGAVRSALLAQGVLVSAVPLGRSPDQDVPLLRVSTAAWVSEEDLDRLAALLISATSAG